MGITHENETHFVINSRNLLNKTDDLDDIFRMYIEDINPFIVRFEVTAGEFPSEVQNEIRAMYGHLARAAMAETEEQVTSNIEKIKSHSKRALLDCFKYTSILCSDEYEGFMSRYEGIDLTYLDEGRFLPGIVSRYEAAKKALQTAKISETTNLPQDELFDLYQDAYQQFEELSTILKKNEEKAAFLQHKATRKDQLSIISFIVGVAGFVVGVIGVVIALI